MGDSNWTDVAQIFDATFHDSMDAVLHFETMTTITGMAPMPSDMSVVGNMTMIGPGGRYSFVAQCSQLRGLYMLCMQARTSMPASGPLMVHTADPNLAVKSRTAGCFYFEQISSRVTPPPVMELRTT